jgi:hypothetical protein
VVRFQFVLRRTPRRYWIAVGIFAIFTTTAISACGAARPRVRRAEDKAQVRSVITAYINATANGQTALACSLMTPDAQTKAAKIARGSGVGTSCSAGMAYVTRLLRATHLIAVFAALKVTRVEITGNAATATILGRGRTGHVYLRRISSRWLVINGPRGIPPPVFVTLAPPVRRRQLPYTRT